MYKYINVLLITNAFHYTGSVYLLNDRNPSNYVCTAYTPVLPQLLDMFMYAFGFFLIQVLEKEL